MLWEKQKIRFSSNFDTVLVLLGKWLVGLWTVLVGRNTIF